MHFWISNKQVAYFFWVYLTFEDFIKRPLIVQCRLFVGLYFYIKSNHMKEQMAMMHFTICLNWCMFITFLEIFILYIYAWLEITKLNCSVLIYLAQSWKSKVFFLLINLCIILQNFSPRDIEILSIQILCSLVIFSISKQRKK